MRWQLNRFENDAHFNSLVRVFIFIVFVVSVSENIIWMILFWHSHNGFLLPYGGAPIGIVILSIAMFVFWHKWKKPHFVMLVLYAGIIARTAAEMVYISLHSPTTIPPQLLLIVGWVQLAFLFPFMIFRSREAMILSLTTLGLWIAASASYGITHFGATQSKSIFAGLSQVYAANIVLIVFMLLYARLRWSYLEANKSRHRMLRKNEALRYQLTEAQIAFLRAQIAPHFFFNALNSISALCESDPKQAGEVTDELANYLRSRFDFRNTDKSIPLKKELDYVTSYIKVEQARFGERLHVQYEVDACDDVWIPPLVVQPIVENAIKHGLQNRLTGVQVSIVVARVGTNAEIRITDDGQGMDEATVNRILQGLDNDHVGIRNVNERLKRLYGEGLSIASELGKGTSVAFKIPVGVRL